MKNLKKIISILAVLVVAVVVAGVAIIKSIDFNEYRGLIAEQVKAATGRDVTISGNLDLELSMSPAVAVEGVTFANASWGSRPEMIKLKRFSAEIELLPLLTGDVRVKRLVLAGLDLLVETDAKGRGNWEMGGKKDAAKSDKPSSANLPVVERVLIQDLKVTYLDGRSGEKTSLNLGSLNIRSDGPKQPMNVDLAGDFNGMAFSVSGKMGSVEALLKGIYRLDGLAATIDKTSFNGRVSVKLSGVPRPFLTADLTSPLIDLDSLLPKGGKGVVKKKRVFPADPLPLDGLKGADARINLKVDRLLAGGISLNDIEAVLALKAGRLNLKPLKAVVAGGQINAALAVDSIGVSVNLTADKIDYGDLLGQLKKTGIATGKFDANIDLKGKGKSVRAIMAGLNGRARLVTQGGKVESGLLNVLSADIMSALPFVDSKGDKTIRCGVVDLDIRKGQARAKAMIFETGGLSMIGKGGINLADETINLKINPRAKKVSLLKLAMIPVNVSGTLANPSAAPDLAGTAVGVVTGAVSTAKDIATGGVSAIGNLVGLGGKKDSASASANLDDTDYCKLALAGRPLVRARAKTSAPQPPKEKSTPPPSTTMEKVDDKLNKLGNDLGGALKGLFSK